MGSAFRPVLGLGSGPRCGPVPSSPVRCGGQDGEWSVAVRSGQRSSQHHQHHQSWRGAWRSAVSCESLWSPMPASGQVVYEQNVYALMTLICVQQQQQQQQLATITATSAAATKATITRASHVRNIIHIYWSRRSKTHLGTHCSAANSTEPNPRRGTGRKI